MVWYCTKHEKHSIDDVCPDCDSEPTIESLTAEIDHCHRQLHAVIDNTDDAMLINIARYGLRVPTKDSRPTEKCMFCDTQIEVPAPMQYAVICAPCRQKAYETADRLFGKNTNGN
jgi:hypothetical protein